jgi:Xaa-Pro aminopeptidase
MRHLAAGSPLARRWSATAVLLVATASAAAAAAAAAQKPTDRPVLGPAPASLTQADYVARRDSLLAHIDSGVVVVPGAREPVEHFPPFRQRPSFRYLTGFLEPDATLILIKRGGSATGTIFVEPPAPRTEFYTGARVRYDELGRRLSLGARSKDDVNAVLDSLVATHLPYYFVSDAESAEFIEDDSLSFGRALARRLGSAHPGLDIRDATPIVAGLRARKSTAEVALIRRAADISSLGHRAAMQALAPNMNEFEIQALMEYTFRRNGADRPSYASIVGSGPNSTTLHYDHDNRVMHAGEVLVMDVAAEYQGYAADITRTLPVDGKFTADQRVIYQIVRDAQAAGERQVQPGVPARQEVDSIFAVVSAGLARLGLIDSVGATVEAPSGFCRSTTNRCPQVSLFLPHGPGHGLGLDVHDPAQWYSPPNQFGVGDVFTIEPGIYIRPGILDILPDTPDNRAFMTRVRPLLQRYANIGVRIEDNYVVTPTGIERLSMVPREINEVEAIMHQHLTTAAARDANLVGSYPASN